MAKIVRLTDDNNETVYPQSKYNAILDENGVGLPNTFDKLIKYNPVVSTSQSTILDNYYTKTQTNNLISNPNLLINGDFQINQRGQTTYSSGDKYTVDRWVQRAGTTTTILDKGIRIATVGSEHHGLNQTIENFQNLYGQTLTVSAKITALNNNNLWRLRITRANSSWLHSNTIDGKDLYITEPGIVSLTFDFSASSMSTSTRFNIGFYSLGGTVGDYIDVEWVKLEVGSIATPLSPRPYAEELTLCQRYYTVSRSGACAGTCISSSESRVQFNIGYINRQILRPYNTVTLNTAPNWIRGGGSYYGSMSSNPATLYSYFDDGRNIVLKFPSISANTLTENETYVFDKLILDIDAEIY